MCDNITEASSSSSFKKEKSYSSPPTSFATLEYPVDGHHMVAPLAAAPAPACRQ
jgi:hypothetical protein